VLLVTLVLLVLEVLVQVYSYTKQKQVLLQVNLGNGFILWNNATQINSTSINVSHLTDDGTDIDVFLALLTSTETILIQDQNDSANYQDFLIMVPNNAGYWTFGNFNWFRWDRTTNFANNQFIFSIN
jgi:hypothetical protein